MKYEVIIVGTGPAGLTLANILGKAKVRTLVLEQDSGLSHFPKALNIDDEFFRLLHTLGMGEQLKQHAKYPISYDYVSPLGLSLGFVEGRITEHNFPNRAAIFQPEFEKILYDAAFASNYVTFLFDQKVLSISDEQDGVIVVAKQSNDMEVRHHAQYLVGADGAHSICRKQLGLPLNEVDKFDVRHIVIDVIDDIDPSPRALTKMGWRRNFFSMPAPNGRRFEFSLQKNEATEEQLNDDTLRRLFKPWRKYDDLKIIRKVVHTFRARIVPTLSVGKVFLVGDAAHLMPIFGSQGMNSGARDANNLGWKLARVIKYGTNPSLLDTYQTERWEAVLKTIKMATTNGKLQMVQSIPMSLLRDLFFGLLKLVPPATRYIREMKYIPKPFLRSRLIQEGTEKGKKGEMIGRVNPNPLVSVQGESLLLDDLIGDQFSLIGISVHQDQFAPIIELAQELDACCIILNKLGPPSLMHHKDIQQANVLDDRYDPLFKHYSGQWLLIRPDRIVACAGFFEHFINDSRRILAEL
ncbi:FAD-dependent monooxygenase [Advenella sp. RU8]|uniref:FAD-dependent monooxygenase n=1 Tax=Advenella sp. RU8 TaxID=3399575 RepID=UPI003AAD09FB